MAALVEGRSGPWEMVIGLEIHAQVSSEAKLFSVASTAFGAEPNTQVSLVDAAMPGMLPVINARCVEQAGFEALYMTGAGVSHARLGMPDLGLMSFSEMLDQAGRIADAVDIPLIAEPIALHRIHKCHLTSLSQGFFAGGTSKLRQTYVSVPRLSVYSK